MSDRAVGGGLLTKVKSTHYFLEWAGGGGGGVYEQNWPIVSVSVCVVDMWFHTAVLTRQCFIIPKDFAEPFESSYIDCRLSAP